MFKYCTFKQDESCGRPPIVWQAPQSPSPSARVAPTYAVRGTLEHRYSIDCFPRNFPYNVPQLNSCYPIPTMYHNYRY
jgi:hypothetical protein